MRIENGFECGLPLYIIEIDIDLPFDLILPPHVWDNDVGIGECTEHPDHIFKFGIFQA